MARIGVWLLAVTACATSGCAAARSVEPARGVTAAPGARIPRPVVSARALAAAIERDDPEGVYVWMHPRLRTRISFAAFQAAFDDNRNELREMAGLLRTRELQERARAEVTLADGELVTLVLEEGSWRMSGALLDAHALASPRDTIVALHGALLRRDLPALLRILTRERRAQWQAALGRGLDATADPLDLDVEVQGETAIVESPDGTRIHLQQESGTWHVADIE